MSWAIWITGLPGSGKSTIARAAAQLLRDRGRPVTVLDLDAVRKRIAPRLLYTEAERELVYRALGYMAAALTEGGVPVIVDATAHRRAWREAARAAIPRFAEVQLLCPLDVCGERERRRAPGEAPASIYARAGRPGATVPGVDVAYERALKPELVIDTTVDAPQAAAAKVAALADRLAETAESSPARAAGWAIWITGRPGSGKTTLAARVAEALHGWPVPVQVLDLHSARRTILGRGWAAEAGDELVHRTLALTAKLLTEAGVAVILDATAPRRAWREAAREWIAHFGEVQLVCPPEVCVEREQAARWRLGASQAAGGTTGAPDIVLEYEESLHPDLRLHTHVPDLMSTVDEVLALARRLTRAAGRVADTERTVP